MQRHKYTLTPICTCCHASGVPAPGSGVGHSVLLLLQGPHQTTGSSTHLHLSVLSDSKMHTCTAPPIPHTYTPTHPHTYTHTYIFTLSNHSYCSQFPSEQLHITQPITCVPVITGPLAYVNVLHHTELVVGVQRGPSYIFTHLAVHTHSGQAHMRNAVHSSSGQYD